jgi:hypothetical protein
MTRLEERLTDLQRVMYGQNKEKRAVFIDVTTVLPAFGPVGLPMGTLLGAAEVSGAALGWQEAHKGTNST